MEKKTILCIIDNLEKGGAEIMLVGILQDLNKKFNVIMVTLSDKCEFRDDEIIYDHKYSLGFKNKFSLASCIIKLRKIIKNHNPHLIHSHLIYSSLIARMACPASIPLIYSIHGEVSKSDFNDSKILTFLEKVTIRKNHSLMAVSQVVLNDYEQIISKNKLKSFVLHNFIADKYIEQQILPKSFESIKSLNLVAIGNIKEVKNYEYLLNVFAQLKDYPIKLDIYGNTGQYLYSKGLQAEIDRLTLNVYFKGSIDNVHEKLKEYDLYIMSSKHEGFGIAVIEAMACGLPLLLSNIPVMKEITLGNALFFNLNNPETLADLLKEILAGKHNLSELSEKGLMITKKYSKKEYLKSLFGIYDQLIFQTAGK